MIYRSIITLSLFVLLLTVGGCRSQPAQQDPANVLPARGFFKTVNNGTTWQQLGTLYTLDGVYRTFGNINPTLVTQDPLDPSALYIGTTTHGIYYSYNDGEGWFQTIPDKGVVNALAIDYRDKCTLYTVIHNKVLKTIDCARSWEVIHFSSIENEFFNSIGIDRIDNNIIYVGTSKGTLLRSLNSGRSWDVMQFFNFPIQNILTDHRDASKIYLTTAGQGIYRSSDNGQNWQELHKLPVFNVHGDRMLGTRSNPLVLAELGGALTYYDLKLDSSQNEGLIYASGYGIFRLLDGDEWREIEILNKPREEQVLSIAVDETNGKNIYFGTSGAFYISEDNGVNWSVKTLPASGLPKFIHIPPNAQNQLYVGFVAN